MKNTLAKILGTSLGFGYMPIAPGTWGAAIGVVAYYFLYHSFPNAIHYILFGLVVIGTIVGTWCCEQLKSEWGDDPSRIVLDESVGVWLTLLFAPFSWPIAIVGFILFRIFDIWKPLGVRTLDQKIKNGFGVMADDLLAGLYAAVVLQMLIRMKFFDLFV